MPYYRSERNHRNPKSRGNPYVYRKARPTPQTLTVVQRLPSPQPPQLFAAQNIIPSLMSPSFIPLPSTAETRDAGTQTITRDKNLDPINFARLYINTQISGETIEEKRQKFFDDDTLNENLRKSYRKYIEDHGHKDEKSKLTKVDRKYHLIDRTLRTKIEQMTPDQIKREYFGIGWDYLGLQARMEYQLRYCKQLSETDTDEQFFQDKTILTNLKIGYSRWKSENISSNNQTITMHIDKSSHNQSQTQNDLDDTELEGDVVPLMGLLPDITLNTNISTMSVDEIESTYDSIDKDILGLQARIEYAEEKTGTGQATDNIHNLDIDFMLDEQVPQIVRSWYRKWLSNNQLIKRQDEMFVVRLSNNNNDAEELGTGQNPVI